MATKPQQSDEFNVNVDELPLIYDENGEPEEILLEVEEEAEDILESELDYDSLLGKNLADIDNYSYLTENQLEEIKNDILNRIDNDLVSMEKHFDTLKQGADLLGIDLKEAGARGAWSCGATHPLIIENAIKLQGLAINELDHPDKPVKAQIVGSSNLPDIEQMAQRKAEHMNFVVSHTMADTFYPENAKLYLGVGLHGVGYKKNYWDSKTKKIVSEYYPIDRVIVNNDTKVLGESCYSCLEPTTDVAIIADMSNGVYRKLDLDEVSTGDTTEINQTIMSVTTNIQEMLGFTSDSERILCDTYMYLDVNKYLNEEEGEVEDTYYERKYLPFVITTELISGEILSIYANWEEGDADYKPLEYMTDYHLIRGFGFFSLGYIHILGNFAKMLTGIMRSLVDAGTFATLPAGFKLKGIKTAGNHEFSPGEFKDIDSTVQDISKAIMALPFKEPSAVFTNLFTILTDAGQKFANGAEGFTQNAASYGSVGTTLALLESSSGMTNSILRGFHLRRKHEYGVIAKLIKDYMGPEYPYYMDGELKKAMVDDYSDDIAIIPASESGVTTQAQRMALAQAKLDIALKAPKHHNIKEALRGVYAAMGEQSIDRLVPPDVETPARSPMEDIMAAANTQPIKAFPGQDHAAHIQFKQAFIQNPEYAGNEFFKMAIPAIVANIREHMLLQLQERIGAMASGVASDAQSNEMVQAMAMQELTRMAQITAQAAANAEDPTAQLAKVQAEKNAIDMKRIDSQEVRDYAKSLLDKEKLELEKEKLGQQAKIEDNKIMAKLAESDAKLQASSQQAEFDRAISLLGQLAGKQGSQ